MMNPLKIENGNSADGNSVICFELPQESAAASAPSGYRVLNFDSYPQYAKTRPDSSCFVIGTDDARKGCNLLKNLRAERASALKPIYLLKSLGDPADRMSDGVVDSIEEAFAKAARIVALLLELNTASLEGPGNDAYRLLGYMYSRPKQCLEPCNHWRNRKYYGFPIIDAMLGETGDTTLLQNLLVPKLIAPLRLEDRLHHCPECDGVHLNYIDVCPA